MNCVKTGRKYEEIAAVFLKEQGFSVIEKNYRGRQGEIDIIGIHENCLVFVEVKYRRDDKSGIPEEAVGAGKQGKICRTSDYFRLCHRQYDSLQIRYDVVAITGEEIRWYQNAFPYQKGNFQKNGW